jgi:hypothetical protein
MHRGGSDSGSSSGSGSGIGTFLVAEENADVQGREEEI